MSTTFNGYQSQALSTAEYPNIGDNLLYPVLGLTGEAGEVAEKLKKLWRNQSKTSVHQFTVEEKYEIAKELGDVLWYVAALSSELGFDLETVATINLGKLDGRKKRGVIKSEGDNR